MPNILTRAEARWWSAHAVLRQDVYRSSLRQGTMAAADTGYLIPSERIEGAILVIRGKKVMLSRDLAALYA